MEMSGLSRSRTSSIRKRTLAHVLGEEAELKEFAFVEFRASPRATVGSNSQPSRKLLHPAFQLFLEENVGVLGAVGFSFLFLEFKSVKLLHLGVRRYVACASWALSNSAARFSTKLVLARSLSG